MATLIPDKKLACLASLNCQSKCYRLQTAPVLPTTSWRTWRIQKAKNRTSVATYKLIKPFSSATLAWGWQDSNPYQEVFSQQPCRWASPWPGNILVNSSLKFFLSGCFVSGTFFRSFYDERPKSFKSFIRDCPSTLFPGLGLDPATAGRLPRIPPRSINHSKLNWPFYSDEILVLGTGPDNFRIIYQICVPRWSWK